MIRSRCISGYKVQGARFFFAKTSKLVVLSLGIWTAIVSSLVRARPSLLNVYYFLLLLLYKFELRELR